MKEKIKVLYFVDRMLRGGIQSFVLENYKYMDKNKIQLDFLLLDDGNHYEMEEDLKKLGCNIFILEGMWIRGLKDFFKYSKMLDEFFKEHNDYRVVHMHSSSKNFLVLKYAKKYGIKTRIAHSHNIDFQTKNLFKKMTGNFLKFPLRKYANYYFACSELAGEWLFGKKIVKSDNFFIVPNAVDLKKFKFNNVKRKNVREQLKINDDVLLVGNVGRFTYQKNHSFLIDVFDEIKKQNKNAKLILIGTGKNEKKIRNKVEKLNLQDDVIFEGFKTNINDYLSAMDLFVFPSKFEGLGMVLIEAQATGLPCYTSKDVVPKEAKVSSLLKYISLKKSPLEWANEILNNDIKRKNVQKEIKSNGYDIIDSAKMLENFYVKNN